MIKLEHHKDIAVLQLYRPPANAIDIELCSALENAVRAEVESESKAIILTGQGAIFSAGMDLVKLLNGGSDYICEFLNKLEQLMETLIFCPKPMVAAINGHAIAGGCVIATCADQRLMVHTSARIGMPELKVGVPFPVIIMELMRSRINSATFEEIVLGGANYTADKAQKKGLVDEIVSADELMDRAMARARSLAEIRPEIYSLTKMQVRQPVREATAKLNAVQRDQIVSIWGSQQTQRAIREYMEKTFKK